MQRLNSSSDIHEADTYFTGSAATRAALAAQSQSWTNLANYELNSSIREYTLNIVNEKSFVPTAKKEKGTRPGAIGYLKPNKEVLFMLKVEDFHYASSITTNPTESVALESLCSQLIRFIFGKQYAANINLIKHIESDSSPEDEDEDEDNEHPAMQNKYAVFSLWENNCTTPSELSQPQTIIATDVHATAINATRIQTIAKLINMDDFKVDNIVKRVDSSLFLIDCSGMLSGFTNKESLFQSHWKKSTIDLGSLFLIDVATETIRTFAEADVIKINLIVESYRPVLSNSSLSLLKSNLEKTRLVCEEILQPRKSASTPSASPSMPRSSYPKLLNRAASSSTADVTPNRNSYRK